MYVCLPISPLSLSVLTSLRLTATALAAHAHRNANTVPHRYQTASAALEASAAPADVRAAGTAPYPEKVMQEQPDRGDA